MGLPTTPWLESTRPTSIFSFLSSIRSPLYSFLVFWLSSLDPVSSQIEGEY